MSEFGYSSTYDESDKRIADGAGKDTTQVIETWLREAIAPAYDAYMADKTRTISLRDAINRIQEKTLDSNRG